MASPVGHLLAYIIMKIVCASENHGRVDRCACHNVFSERERRAERKKIMTANTITSTTTDTTTTDAAAIAAGDIVCWDSGWSMCLPHFAKVIRRTRCMLVVEELQSYSVLDDGYGTCGMKMPTNIGTGNIMKLRLHRGRWFATQSGDYVHPWDGKAMHYDYMD